MIRRKDGSLNLSIQAIVILVMAMALLGLGLSFIRVLFDKGGAKLVGEIDNIKIMQANEGQPISITNTVPVRQGKYQQLQVSVYNKDLTGTNTNYDINTNNGKPCSGQDFIIVSCPATIDVPTKEQRAFGCSVYAAKNMAGNVGAGTVNPGLYTCQITLEPQQTTANSISGSFFVEVTI